MHSLFCFLVGGDWILDCSWRAPSISRTKQRAIQSGKDVRVRSAHSRWVRDVVESTVMRPHSAIFLLALLFSAVVTQAQIKPTKDISVVYAEGKTTGTEYKNEYFALTLTAAPGQFTQGGFVSSKGKRARLVDVENNSSNFQDKFEIAVLADSLAANPLVQSPEQYARSVRHQFEKEGMKTERAESPIEVSGLPFVQAILKVNEGGSSHYRAFYTTFLNGHILSLDVSAATPEKIAQVVTRAVKFESKNK
jgi:hypothetical protein